MSIRYAQFAGALKDLQALANNPDLNDPQKKAVTDLTGELKQSMEKSSTP
jgi:hypothetical protein